MANTDVRDGKQDNGGIGAEFKIGHSGYCIRPVIEIPNGESITFVRYEWWFNPAEMVILDYIEELQALIDKPTEAYADFNKLLKKICELIDNIFDEKVSRIILRNCDAEYTFLFEVCNKIGEAHRDFIEKANVAAKKREAENREKAVEAAKAESAAFLSNA